MSVNGTISTVVSIGGVSMSSTITRTKSSPLSHSITVPAGNTSTDFTKTDNDTGEAELASAHTITDGDVVDVFWGTASVRYGMIATVDGTTVGLEGGAGDNLPDSDTTLIVATQQHINTADLDGDEVYMVAAAMDQIGHMHLRSSEASGAGGSLLAKRLAANEVWEWHSTVGTDPADDASNDLAGSTLAQIDVSNGSTTAATFKFAALYDATG